MLAYAFFHEKNRFKPVKLIHAWHFARENDHSKWDNFFRNRAYNFGAW